MAISLYALPRFRRIRAGSSSTSSTVLGTLPTRWPTPARKCSGTHASAAVGEGSAGAEDDGGAAPAAARKRAHHAGDPAKERVESPGEALVPREDRVGATGQAAAGVGGVVGGGVAL